MTTLKMSAERNVRQSTKIISYPMKQTQAGCPTTCPTFRPFIPHSVTLFFADEPKKRVPYPPRLSEGGLPYCLRHYCLRLPALSYSWNDVPSSASPLLLHKTLNP